MPLDNPWILGLAQCVPVGLLSIAMALLLRRVHCPGGRCSAALIAGVAAGIILGAGVLGRIVPAAYQPVYVGGSAESAELLRLRERQQAELSALVTSGVTDTAIDDLRRQHQEQAAPLVDSLSLVTGTHRRQFDLLVAAIAALHAALASFLATARPARAWLKTAACAIDTRWRDAAWGSLALLLAGAIPFAVAHWALGMDFRLSLGTAAALAAPGLSGTMPARTFIACAVGLALAAAWLVIAAWSLPLSIVAAGVAIGLLGALWSDRRVPAPTIRLIARLSAGVTLPLLAALLTVTLDPHAIAASQPFIAAGILAALLSSDGRWAAARAAQSLTHAGLRGAWTRAGESVSAGSSTCQLLAAAALGWLGAPPFLIASLLLGAIVIELSSRPRAELSRLFDQGRE